MKTSRIIAIGYGIVVVFLAAFLLVNAFGHKIGLKDHEPRWALLIAAAAIVPLLWPIVQRELVPRISGLKIPNIVELSFTKSEVAPRTFAGLPDTLPVGTGDVQANEYASMMTSYSAIIVGAIQGVTASGDPVLVVNLGDGKKWVPPNLFILAVLARDLTDVHLIAFVETRRADNDFIGMASPRDLIAGLSAAFPILDQALTQSAIPATSPSIIATGFFASLSTLYSTVPPPTPGSSPMSLKDMWLDGAQLLRLLDTRIYSDHVEWTEPLSGEAAKQVVRSPHPYVAAVQKMQLQFVIDRDRFLLLMVRQLIAP